MRWNRPQVLFTAFTLAVLFSVQYPLPFVNSRYASLNLSDIVLAAIFVAFFVRFANRDEMEISLTLPRVTSLYVVVSAWIMLSTAVALVRSPVPVLPNVLWMLKWLEVLVLLVLVQQYRSEVDWRRIVKTIVAGATLIAIVSIGFALTTTGWARATVLWRNPNTLAVFLALPGLLCLVYGAERVQEAPRRASSALALALILILGIGGTGSRSGVITLVVGTLVAIALAHGRISNGILVGGFSAALVLGLGGLWATGRMALFERFFPTIMIQEGELIITGSGSSGIQSRLELTKEAINLWLQQPIFGYGWFSSPENPMIGFLDVFYSQVLVDVGIIGFVLVMLLYASFVRAFVIRSDRSVVVVCIAGAAWVVGMLAAGIGGAHARVPRLMFLMVLLLAAAANLGDYTTDDPPTE